MTLDLLIDEGTQTLALRTRKFIGESVIPLECGEMASLRKSNSGIRVPWQTSAVSAKIFTPTSPEKLSGLDTARRERKCAMKHVLHRPMCGTSIEQLRMAQQIVVDNEIYTAAFSQLVRHATEALEVGQPARRETSLSRTFFSDDTFRIADGSIQFRGSSGTPEDPRTKRIIANLRRVRICDKPSGLCRMSLNQRALGQLPTRRLFGDQK